MNRILGSALRIDTGKGLEYSQRIIQLWAMLRFIGDPYI